jgi:alkylresorcinol/alkylpyrone synthase
VSDDPRCGVASMTGSIVGIGSSFPPALDQQQAWDGFFETHYSNNRLARRVWRTAGIDQRHSAVNPSVEDLSFATTGTRMEKFAVLAVPLACDAVSKTLKASGLSAGEVDLWTVVSCTGYATPGVDILVARELGMRSSLQRLNIGHMGCYAALPALTATADAAAARGKIGVMLCVELTSLHIQPPTDDIEQVVAHALFSDAAAAVALVPDAAGLEVVDMVCATDSSTSDLMTWRITDLGFRMRLSSKVPAILDQHVLALTTELLARHELKIADVDHWAIHPGGPRIIDTVARRLGLPDSAVDASRDTLRSHGNCSSATTLLVLHELSTRSEILPGQHVVAMAFGPGLTLCAVLLRYRK